MNGSARLVLFTGKGGAGRTTVAAATAVHAARCGIKTLFVTTDPAPIDRVGLTGLGLTRRGFAGSEGAGAEAAESGPMASGQFQDVDDGLTVVSIGAGSTAGSTAGLGVGPISAASGRRPLPADLTAGLLAELEVDQVSALEVPELPGLEDLGVLLEIKDLVAAGTHDLVLVDGPPAAGALRWSGLPDTVLHVLHRALPVGRRVSRAMALGTRQSDAAAGRPPRDHVVETAEWLAAEMRALRALLDAPTTTARVVITAEGGAVAQTRALRTALALHGVGIDGVIVNRLFPASGPVPLPGLVSAAEPAPESVSGGWHVDWARTQRRHLDAAMTAFGDVGVLTVCWAPAEPVGAAALASMAEVLYGKPSPHWAQALLAAPDRARSPKVEADGNQFVLIIELPLAVRSELQLARIGDHLRVAVRGQVRMFVLPSVLRRCVVVGARLVQGALRVQFEPDPALWRAL